MSAISEKLVALGRFADQVNSSTLFESLRPAGAERPKRKRAKKIRSELGPFETIVALSGGKDSTAMALELIERDPRNYEYICTPTGNEPEEMFEHWKSLGRLLGKPLTPVMSGTLIGLIKKQNALPNWRQRWCTRILKIEPFALYLARATVDPTIKVTCYVGLRADEMEREGGDYMEMPRVLMDFPMRRWGWNLSDVVDSLNRRRIHIPKRTDCKLRFFQRLIEWYELWRDDKLGWAEGESLEEKTGHTFRSPSRDTWPASMVGLRKRFEAGDIPKDTRDPLNAMKCRVCRI